MSDNILPFGQSSDQAIRALHAKIEQLASVAAGSYVSRTPIRIDYTTDGFRQEMQYWYDDDGLKIFTCDGGVHMSSTLEFQYWPDWQAVTPERARAMARALLSAAAYVSPDVETAGGES